MSNLVVRSLNLDDAIQVDKLDNESGNYVGQWLEDNTDYAWGAFLDEGTQGMNLIGYCTIGYADDCSDVIEKHPLHTLDSLLLSDVYITPDYRRHDYGSKMIQEAISLRHELEGSVEAVFLMVLNDSLRCFYEPLGFSFINEGCWHMVRDDKKLNKHKTNEERECHK